jgi:hypothetical protein
VQCHRTPSTGDLSHWSQENWVSSVPGGAGLGVVLAACEIEIGGAVFPAGIDILPSRWFSPAEDSAAGSRHLA